MARNKAPVVRLPCMTPLPQPTQPKSHPHRAALWLARNSQIQEGYLSLDPEDVFQRLVKEIAGDYQLDVRFQSSVLAALQEAAETDSIYCFRVEDTMRVAQHTHRETSVLATNVQGRPCGNNIHGIHIPCKDGHGSRYKPAGLHPRLLQFNSILMLHIALHPSSKLEYFRINKVSKTANSTVETKVCTQFNLHQERTAEKKLECVGLLSSLNLPYCI
ncbi:hypothetical protein B0H14DRAFT_2627742 [Mycena olivaceomarginata]|nr:hypothetical protein B0H14DRAFT_2627742 [Mycena olivaceomarginata]